MGEKRNLEGSLNLLKDRFFYGFVFKSGVNASK